MQLYRINAVVKKHLNGRVSALNVETESRRWSVVKEKYSSEYIRFIPEGHASSPDELHRVVLQSLILVIVVIAGKEQSIVAHLGDREGENKIRVRRRTRAV